MDRPLTEPRHWRRARGRQAAIELADGTNLLARIGPLTDDGPDGGTTVTVVLLLAIYALVIVTEWNAFRALDFKRLRATMTSPVLVDLRNVYRAAEVERHGFRYSGIGQISGGAETPFLDLKST